MRDKWLQRLMTFDEAVAHLAGVDEVLAKLLRAGTRRCKGESSISKFCDWYAQRFRPGDELWWYDMGGWEEMAGENGFAIVRNDETAYTLPQMRN